MVKCLLAWSRSGLCMELTKEWMNVCMIEWLNKILSVGTSVLVIELMRECWPLQWLIYCLNEWTDEMARVLERARLEIDCTHGMNERMNGLAIKRTNESVREWNVFWEWPREKSIAGSPQGSCDEGVELWWMRAEWAWQGMRADALSGRGSWGEPRWKWAWLSEDMTYLGRWQ